VSLGRGIEHESPGGSPTSQQIIVDSAQESETWYINHLHMLDCPHLRRKLALPEITAPLWMGVPLWPQPEQRISRVEAKCGPVSVYRLFGSMRLWGLGSGSWEG